MRLHPGDVPCPACHLRQSYVLDTAGTQTGSVRRRRQCVCGQRYTTYEHLGRDPKIIAERINEIEDLLRAIRAELQDPPPGM